MNNLLYEKLTLNGIPVALKQFMNHKTMHFHWHEEIEILYFVAGKEKIYINEHEIIAATGDIIVINSGESHRGTMLEDNTSYYIFHLNTNVLPHLINDEKIILIENKINDLFAEKILKSIIKESSDKDLGYELALHRDVYSLLVFLTRNKQKEIKQQKNTYFRHKELINNIVMYINNHCDEELTVSMLAKKFYMSNSYFSHFFKNNINKSVIEYINDLRIEKSKFMLRNSNDSISCIAASVGFSDFNYFTRLFKKKVGVPPSKFRT